ncbi:flagellar hook-length control protein FliK [Tabrizicola flagellatus]|uniref:flagellar hook-length control protein FliK n=1 Tax=Tabrizicola flagellatus TaxID=2593021 RepID=UPI0011F0D7FA|nr:flagellar hook-length control protein FliK [Tabrizicola flagellatus]
MQNALIIGPIAVSFTEAGFIQTRHDGQAFADSFCETLVHPGPTDPETDNSLPAPGVFFWNDGLLSTALRDWTRPHTDAPRVASDADLPSAPTALAGTLLAIEARTGPDWGSADPEATPSGHGTEAASGAPEGEAANSPVLLRATAGAVPIRESLIPPGDLYAAIPILEGRGHALLSSETAAPLFASLDRADGLPSTLALAEIAPAGDKAADGERSLPMVADDRPRRDGQATDPVALQRSETGAINQIRQMNTGRSEEIAAARLPTSGLAVVEAEEHHPVAGASNQPPDPWGKQAAGQSAAPGGSRSEPDVALPRFPAETGTGPSFDARSEPDEPASSPSVTGSFWERVFHDATKAQAAGAQQPSTDGEAIPLPVATSTAHAADKDQTVASIAPAQVDSTWPPDPTEIAGPATQTAAVSQADLVSRLVVEAWPDPGSLTAATTDAIAVSGVSAPSSGPASQAAASSPVFLPVPQVATQVAAVLRRTAGGAAELSLAPIELGRVRLRIEPDARDPDRLLILINVERPETLELFRRHAAELAEAIRSAGYAGSSIDFGQQGQGNRREAGRDDRPSLAAPESRDMERGQLPFRNVTGETLDLRL